MLTAQGNQILFVDADGATRFSDIQDLMNQLPKNGVAIGSRAHMVETEAVVKVLRLT